jgi:hypothetical protein
LLPILRKWKMDQDNKTNITYRKGHKRSPASPAQYARRLSKSRARSGRATLLNILNGKNLSTRPASTIASGRSFHGSTGLARSEVTNMRQPDPITLHRISKLWAAARPLLGDEITIAWLSRTLIRVDGGPMLDAPRLGPALRMLGFRRVRRRRGSCRVSAWLQPGAPPPRVGRPRIAGRVTKATTEPR